MKTLLAILVLDLVPELYLAPLVAIGGFALFNDIRKDIQTDEALIDSFDVYTKDYTELNPEWKWGNHKGVLDYHELLGFTFEALQKEVFSNTLIKTTRKNVPKTNYTLSLYFQENVCVRVEYRRPEDKTFLACYEHGQESHFHVYSELYGNEYPIDLNVNYTDVFNLHNSNSQMRIIAGFCAEKFPYVSSTSCCCK